MYNTGLGVHNKGLAFETNVRLHIKCFETKWHLLEMFPPRVRKAPDRYGSWIYKLTKQHVGTKHMYPKVKLHAIKDILKTKLNSAGELQAEVTWCTSTNGKPNSPNVLATEWINLNDNPELFKFLQANELNPYSSTLAKNLYHDLAKSQPMNNDVLALRQAIFDALSYRYTGEGQRPASRQQVSIPFGKDNFVSTFGHLPQVKNSSVITNSLPGTYNVSIRISPAELTHCIGQGWSFRSFNTSTITYINFKRPMLLKWQYKARTNYNHDDCERCTYTGNNVHRPVKCTPTKELLLGPPWLTITFHKARRNRVANILAEQKKVCLL